MAPDFYRALESFIQRYPCQIRNPSPSTLTVLTPTSYSSKEGVVAGHRGQFTPYPGSRRGKPASACCKRLVVFSISLGTNKVPQGGNPKKNLHEVK